MHNISIYLLKSEISDTEAIRQDLHPRRIECTSLPDSVLYLSNRDACAPWWLKYLGVNIQMFQQSQGALLLFKVEESRFAIAFGQGYRLLNDFAYEYDFGMICTLNAVDPEKLKTVDSVSPSDSKRRRVQMPKDSRLDVFDVLRSESILSRMTGVVKSEFVELFKSITGSAQARISTNVSADKLPAVCACLKTLYESDDYKQTFHALRNVCPVKDPYKIKELDEKLCEAFHRKDPGIVLSIPEVVLYGNFASVCFGENKTYSMVVVDSLWQHFGDRVANVSIEDLKRRYHMSLLDEDSHVKYGPYSLYKCLSWDCQSQSEIYHICDGLWYQVDKDFLANLNSEVHDLFEESTFPPNDSDSESKYNEAVSLKMPEFTCVDKKLIRLSDAGSLEPCDLFRVTNGIAEFVHVKIGVVSSRLSHLFNQGSNSVELLLTDRTSRMEFRKNNPSISSNWEELLLKKKCKVVFLVITTKKQEEKEKNLPFFSRMSLRRVARVLQSMGVDLSVQYVQDNKQISIQKKKRKSRTVASGI